MIRIAPYRRGGWEIDIRLRGPNGDRIRERIKSPVSSKSGSRRWAQLREQELLTRAVAVARGEAVRTPAQAVPTLEAFYPRWLREHAEADRQKPSGIAAKRTILTIHLVPLLGSVRLDRIGPAEVQAVKVALKSKSAKTVNNALSVLHTLLAKAAEWGVISEPPCNMPLLHYERPEMSFWDFRELEKLISAARDMGPQEYLLILLASKAGLRCGEMMALSWTDVDLERRRLTVRSSEWKGHLTSTKGRKTRLVPMAEELAAALSTGRHLRSGRVLATMGGQPLTQKVVGTIVQRVERRAGMRSLGVHALRHTFCSHLAMRGVPVRAIQDLAGHANLATTMGYMHLSPNAVESAIRTLDGHQVRGDLGETGSERNAK